MHAYRKVVDQVRRGVQDAEPAFVRRMSNASLELCTLQLTTAVAPARAYDKESKHHRSSPKEGHVHLVRPGHVRHFLMAADFSKGRLPLFRGLEADAVLVALASCSWYATS